MLAGQNYSPSWDSTSRCSRVSDFVETMLWPQYRAFKPPKVVLLPLVLRSVVGASGVLLELGLLRACSP